MESSSVFVQHQFFQFCQVFRSDVAKNARRCRWRSSHSKIEANAEFGLGIQRKGTLCACRVDCIREPWWKPNLNLRTYLWPRGMSSNQERGDPTHQTTQNGILTKSGSSQEFTQHTDNDDDMDSNTVKKSDMSLRSRSFLHRLNEWSSAKGSRPIFKRCNTRQQQTFLKMVNVYVFNFGSICVHGKEFLRKFTFHQKYRKDLTLKQMFAISAKLITEQSDEIYEVTPIYWEHSSWRAVGRLLEGRFCSFRRGVLACASGRPTGRGEVRVGRVSWGGVGVPTLPPRTLAGVARGMRAVSEEKGHMYTSTRGDACLPTWGKTWIGVQTWTEWQGLLAVGGVHVGGLCLASHTIRCVCGVPHCISVRHLTAWLRQLAEFC